MKTPETPRSFLPKLAEPPASEEKEGKIVPRYVEIPALRAHGFGPRNLFWGIVTLIIALVLLVVALFFGGPKAVISLATSLLTFTALFVLARLHIFRQRNGGFLALGVVCLLGVAMPLVESGFEALKNLAGGSGKSSGGATAANGDSQPALLTEAFALSKPEGPGKLVKVVKDSRVVIQNRPYLIKEGDLFAYLDSKGNEASFAVRDLRVSLPTSVVEVIDPNAVAQGVSGRRSEPDVASTAHPAPAPAAPATAPSPTATTTADDLASITLSAQREAVRRYPALGIKGSLENEAFVTTYQNLKESGGADFFANPEWPIELAELLAKREGWARGGMPATTGPAPVLDAPRNEAPAPQRPLPPVDTLDAGAGLPSAGDR